MASGKQTRNTSNFKHRERGVTPAHAIAAFKKEGIEVDEEQAKVILDFLYILAKLAVDQYFNDE